MKILEILKSTFFRNDNHRLQSESVASSNRLHEQITTLETSLATKESELLQEKQIKEDLFHQASAVAQSQDSEREYFNFSYTTRLLHDLFSFQKKLKKRSFLSLPIFTLT